MKILLCCEHFHPSVGGVQKMMYEIGLRFIQKDHEVSVVTSFRDDRKVNEVDGINIYSFKVSGNSALGLNGDISAYQDFLIKGQFDFLLVMAAQQWTFDAMLPVLDQIPFKKLHIPCGYSGFYQPQYKEYFSQMANHLHKFDQLIYNSTNYRDINFARDNNIAQINIIPAGASEFEFLNIANLNVKKELGIAEDDFVYLSVGAPAFNKGHKEILKAYLLLDLQVKSTLILNGNYNNEKLTLKELAKRFLGRSSYNIKKLSEKNSSANKKIVFSNLERKKVISLFTEADLFLFASHIEYSPLVIFECLASGLPFLSNAVGNVDEIVEWTNAGVIYSGEKSEQGFSSVNPEVLAIEMKKLALDKELQSLLAKNGREAWLSKFTWKVIVDQIEKLVI
jgi:glycosyltransferase involved in cell wall biosynthesis